VPRAPRPRERAALRRARSEARARLAALGDGVRRLARLIYATRAAPRAQPTEAEIEEYAQWLGMTAEDDDLRWIAREGLKAPLPEHWKPCKTADGEVYYFNFQSGESVWDHPCDEYYRKLFEEEKQRVRALSLALSPRPEPWP
jgi:hypothetical protein